MLSSAPNNFDFSEITHKVPEWEVNLQDIDLCLCRTPADAVFSLCPEPTTSRATMYRAKKRSSVFIHNSSFLVSKKKYKKTLRMLNKRLLHAKGMKRTVTKAYINAYIANKTPFTNIKLK